MCPFVYSLLADSVLDRTSSTCQRGERGQTGETVVSSVLVLLSHPHSVSLLDACPAHRHLCCLVEWLLAGTESYWLDMFLVVGSDPGPQGKVNSPNLMVNNWLVQHFSIPVCLFSQGSQFSLFRRGFNEVFLFKCKLCLDSVCCVSWGFLLDVRTITKELLSKFMVWCFYAPTWICSSPQPCVIPDLCRDFILSLAWW